MNSNAVARPPGAVIQPLNQAIHDAVVRFGAALIAEPENEGLRALLLKSARPAKDYSAELLRLVFRLSFLLLAETRDLLHPTGTATRCRTLYSQTCAVASLDSRLTGSQPGPPQANTGPRHWHSLLTLFRALSAGETHEYVPRLGSFFDNDRLRLVSGCALSDAALLHSIAPLVAGTSSNNETPIDWTSIDAEAFGVAYQAFLEQTPLVNPLQRSFDLEKTIAPHSRRTSGSYYTPDVLVQALLDSALQPVIESVESARIADAASALLELSIVDPACGSGHFLLAAARRLASHVANVDSSAQTPFEKYHTALKQVIQHCIHGVDLDPIAVELCQLSLWFEAADAGMSFDIFEGRILHGNALLSVTPSSDGPALEAKPAREAADTWCAQFFIDAARASKNPDLISRLASEHRFFHWHLEYPQVFARGGFDVVLGNPPWIAHAGRASQALDPALKRFYQSQYEAFAGYPTTHGAFVNLCSQLLREGGRLGLVLPASLSELNGYRATRSAHDRRCDFPADLQDFGEGRFENVTQPCMALVSRRVPAGRKSAEHGAPWPMARPDLSALDRDVLALLSALPTLPPELFGERGVQSDPSLAKHFQKLAAPRATFRTPIREGTDIREFCLASPRYHVDHGALGKRMRALAEFRAVRILVRQTARYPIAALSDGVAFRNSLLAGFELDGWDPALVVAVLNSALVRWAHFKRFRDARQPVLPQVKIGHLRSIPIPITGFGPHISDLTAICQQLHATPSPTVAADLRTSLDDIIADCYGLTAPQRLAINAWHSVASAPRRVK